MTQKYDFERRTTDYAKLVIRLCRTMPRSPINDQLVRQLVRSAGSVGANYREANDALGTRDFVFRLRISRKEAKESLHWLELMEVADNNRQSLITEAIHETEQIKNILSAMINRSIPYVEFKK